MNIFPYFQKNATDGGRFLVSRGIKNIHDLGRVLEFQDEPEMGLFFNFEQTFY